MVSLLFCGSKLIFLDKGTQLSLFVFRDMLRLVNVNHLVTIGKC